MSMAVNVFPARKLKNNHRFKQYTIDYNYLFYCVFLFQMAHHLDKERLHFLESRLNLFVYMYTE